MQTETGKIVRRWLGMGCRVKVVGGRILRKETSMRLDPVFLVYVMDFWAVPRVEQTLS